MIDKLITAAIPLLLAMLGYLFTSLLTIHDSVNILNQKMSILVNMDNQIIPSPDNVIERQKIKEDIMKELLKIDKRLSIVEWRIDNDSRKSR
jgi:hypothetical protein